MDLLFIVNFRTLLISNCGK